MKIFTKIPSLLHLPWKWTFFGNEHLHIIQSQKNQMETCSRCYLWWQISHRKGGSYLRDLEQNVCYTWVNNRIFKRNLKRGHKYNSYHFVCECLKWTFLSELPTSYHYLSQDSNQIELRPRCYVKVLRIRQLSYFCCQNLPNLKWQDWREPVSSAGLVCAEERWKGIKLIEDGLGKRQEKQATVNATSLLWRRSGESANCRMRSAKA